MKRSFAISIAIPIALAMVLSLFAVALPARATHLTQGPPEVNIIQPSGATVSTLGTNVQVFVSNFTLEPGNIGNLSVAGHGHLDVYVNDIPFAPVSVGTSSFDIVDLPAGTVKIGVELVNNDHSSLSPQVWSNITVTAVAPSISFVTPAEGGSVSTEGARFQVDVAGFELDTANYNGNHIPGHGHYHVFMDGGFTGITPTEPSFDLTFTPGDHTVFVDLRRNDHIPLSPSVNATINVTAVAPSIKIVSPANNQGVSGEGFRLVVDIAGWELDTENYNGNPVPGHGHYHVIVDGTMTVGTPQQRTFNMPALSAGSHTITVNLRQNNHVPLSPNVEDTITVNVGAPGISIVSPANGSMVSSHGFKLQVDVSGFELDAENYGGAPIPGRGHYHVIVDGTSTVGTPTEPTFEIGALPAGTHTITVNLRTNDHQLLVPNAEATITVTTVDPSISIVSPAANAVVSTLGVPLEVAIAGWELDGENYNGNPIAGRGHYHVEVDGNTVGTPTTPTFTIGALSAGPHTITVNLRTNNHQLLTPNVEASMTVTAAAPSISIVEPTAGAAVGTVVFLQVAIEGFTLDPENIGGTNVPGRGHYHVAVDGTTIDFEVTGLIYAVRNLEEGDHTIQVSLHNNDHSDLSPVVIDDVTVTVATPTPPIEPTPGVDLGVFIGTTVALLVVIVGVSVVLYLWGRGKQGGG